MVFEGTFCYTCKVLAERDTCAFWWLFRLLPTHSHFLVGYPDQYCFLMTLPPSPLV